MIIPSLVQGIFLSLAGKFTSDIALTVDLGYSKYHGTALSNGVNQWLGIRYAAPPLGDLRFRAPRDPLVNSSLQIADRHGPQCLPTPSKKLSTTDSEDCLFLDVYAPSSSSNLHPVFIFIQGGGLNKLTNPNLPGPNLVVAGNHEIVVVTFNYRVGPWGFLASREVQENGDLNVGLKDQRKVFEWVQKYIHLSGGDPKHVTIGGDSAGAGSVSLHLLAYGGRDDGLFHAAAAESSSFGAQLTVAESQYQYDGLVKRTQCDTALDTLQCLRNLNVKTIAEHNIDSPTPRGGGGRPVFMYSNVIDGDFTPNYTYNMFAEGNFIKVPVIFGDDTNEGTIFAPSSISSYQEMNTFLRNNWVKLTSTQLAKIDSLYPKAEQFPPAGPYWRTASNAYGDMRYTCPGIAISSAFDKHVVQGNWNYHWDVLSTANNVSGYGVTHTAEVGSIWGTSGPPDSKLIPTIQSYWTSFIRSKNPNTYKLASAPEWERFNSTRMARVYFPNDPAKVRMETVPSDQRTRCAYLSSIGAAIAQ